MDQSRPGHEPHHLIVAAARDCIGTRFHHQGRLPGVGLDCVGLLVHAMHAAGVEFPDNTTYARYPDNGMLIRELDARLDHIDRKEARAGDIVAFTWGDYQDTQHVGILTAVEPTWRMVHAHARQRKTVEHDLGDYWLPRIGSVYRIRGATA